MARQSALPINQEKKSAPEKRRLKSIAGPAKQGGAPALDRLVHERLRLGILSALAAGESLTFNELKHHLKASDGNLSVHARRLEEGGYIQCLKSFEGRMPKTEYRLTANGRRALERYVDHMEALIRAMRGK